MKKSDILACIEALPDDSISGLLVVFEGVEMDLSLGDNLWMATCPSLWADDDSTLEGQGPTALDALKACLQETLKEPSLEDEDEDEDYTD